MTPENATYAYVGALVDELVRGGVRHLSLCPGSRSAPLAIAAARHPGLRVWPLIDERSAAFFALGLAKALRAPVAVLSTSGTAAANFLPAVVEARYGRVPLVVLTADRPHELRESGAPQTIDQVRLFGTHVRWFLDLALPEAQDIMLRYVRTAAAQAVAAATEGPDGPVHLNVPLREPLVPLPGPLPPPDERTAAAWEGRPNGAPYAAVVRGRRAPDPHVIAEMAAAVTASRRGVIVCGPSDEAPFPEAVTRLAERLAYPILADPLSQVRCGRHDRRMVVDAYDALLRLEAAAAQLAPDVILRFGGVPASKPLLTYLQRHHAARQIVVDPAGTWADPARLATTVVQADPVLVCGALADAVRPPVHASAWSEAWRRLNDTARATLAHALADVAEPFEGRVFAELADLVPDDALLYVGNSMPVRDLDAFFPSTGRAVRVMGNRGASGIDGLVSSALGAAASGAPVLAVLGDLAFYHDMNGLLAARLHRLRATIVVLHNDGGGIFSFLPQADFPEHFERLFGTPHGLEFRHAAAMYGAAFAAPGDWAAFRDAVAGGLGGEGLTVVEVRTARDRNVVLHRRMWQAVEAAVRPLLEAAAGRVG